jgi:hypothetical protein
MARKMTSRPKKVAELHSILPAGALKTVEKRNKV